MSIPPPRTSAEKTDWLRLIRTENVGPATFLALLRRYGTAARALEAVPQLARRGGAGRALRIASREEAERERAAITSFGAELVALGEPAYPRALADIDSPPPLICLRGHAQLLERRAVAIVGARNASAAGLRMARQLALELGGAGLVIVSGLARGIDTSAHQGALDTGTAAVLAGGIDVCYPPENQALYDAVAARGVLVCEMPPGTAPQARHFPRRNRLISGLAQATLVIEAAERSGSLITAQFALEQGREVMAVPGSPLDPRARGANRLLKDGAVLVQDSRDVLDALSHPRRLQLKEPPTHAADPPGIADEDAATLSALRPRVLELLGPTPVEIDEIVRNAQAPTGHVRAVLLELDLAGRIEHHAGQRVSLKSA